MGRAKDEFTKAIPLLNQNPRAREMLGAIPKVICFDLDGEEKAFCVVIEGGQLKLRNTARREPDIIVSGDANEVAKIVTREREITHPIAEGKVMISKGRLSQMILFDRVLDLRRRTR